MEKTRYQWDISNAAESLLLADLREISEQKEITRERIFDILNITISWSDETLASDIQKGLELIKKRLEANNLLSTFADQQKLRSMIIEELKHRNYEYVGLRKDGEMTILQMFRNNNEHSRDVEVWPSYLIEHIYNDSFLDDIGISQDIIEKLAKNNIEYVEDLMNRWERHHAVNFANLEWLWEEDYQEVKSILEKHGFIEKDA